MKIKILAVLAAATTLMRFSCHHDDNDPNSVNQTDRQFTMKASMANKAEIDAGQLAATKGTDPAVVSYGQHMVEDHTTSITLLRTIAADLNLPAPDSLDAEHVALKALLLTLSGRAFDSVYIH